MVAIRTVILSVATLAASAVAQLAIATPASVVECQPAALSITPGTAPYYISILPGGQVSAAALEQLPTTSATSVTWTCDIAAGTSITFQVKDSTGTIAYSAPITVQAGSTGCLAAGSGTTTAAASTTAASGGTTSAAAGSSSASVAQSSAASVSRSASSAASSVASVASSSASRAASSAASASGSVASASASAKSNAQALKVSGGLLAIGAAAVFAL